MKTFEVRMFSKGLKTSESMFMEEPGGLDHRIDLMVEAPNYISCIKGGAQKDLGSCCQLVV